MKTVMGIFGGKAVLMSLIMLSIMMAPTWVLASSQPASFIDRICFACYFFSPTLLICALGTSLLVGSWYLLKHMRVKNAWV